ncbi:FA32A protein, partial [Columbina picui]|nr:FA32A protein [Columbina picui]
ADYEAVQRGPLRLKGSGGALGAGKRFRGPFQSQTYCDTVNPLWDLKTSGSNRRLVFFLQQMERILKKASKTHKQRVEDFNRHLDTLTEHYDIPKVSWTK